jgi:hypothetical protein
MLINGTFNAVFWEENALIYLSFSTKKNKFVLHFMNNENSRSIM